MDWIYVTPINHAMSILPLYYVVLFSYTLPVPVQGGIISAGLMSSLLLGEEWGGGLFLGPSLENIAILASCF